jgi:hypothetical protein
MQSSSRKDQSSLKTMCLKRYNYHGVVSCVLDPEAKREYKAAKTQLSHIIPFVSGKASSQTSRNEGWIPAMPLVPAEIPPMDH